MTRPPVTTGDARSRGASAALRLLQRTRTTFGGEAAAERLKALEALEGVALEAAEEVLALHEVLCFARAYPDDEDVLAAVERMLAAFGERRDLHRHRSALANSGIAGTDLFAEFYWFTADWLATRWPDQLSIDWRSFPGLDKLEQNLALLLEEHELLALEDSTLTTPDFVDALKAPDETDAVYLIHGFRRFASNPLVRESLYDDIGVPLCLAPGPTTPSRTQAWYTQDPVVFQGEPIARESTTTREMLEREPEHVWRVPPKTGRLLVDLGRGALITRGRDLFAFMHADGNDAFIVDYGGGLQFACLGLIPRYRHLLYGQYIYLALKNGVPIAYIQACVLFDSAEINFNLFDTFRRAETSRVFTSSLALTRQLFDVDAFSINTQQLGEGNPEAIHTGAWWFYYKHGFRPYGDTLRDVVGRELEARRNDPKHHTNAATLRELGSHELHLFLDEPRNEVVGRIDLTRIGLAIARSIGERFGVSGQRAVRASAAEAETLLGLRSQSSWTPSEREAWRRWAPLVIALPGLEAWTRDEKKTLARVIRTKGSRSERDHVLLLREHERLCTALLEMLA